MLTRAGNFRTFNSASDGAEFRYQCIRSKAVAKKQTFADKSKGKEKADNVSIKCIVSVYDDTTQSWKFREKMVRVANANELQNMKL